MQEVGATCAQELAYTLADGIEYVRASIDRGLKLRIEEFAVERQTRIDRAEGTIVGVNTYQLEVGPPMDILQIVNAAVRETQTRRLAEVRKNRNEEACGQAFL